VKVKLVIAFILGAGTVVLLMFLVGPVVISPRLVSNQLLNRPEFLADRPEILSRVRSVLLSRQLEAQGAQRLRLIRGKWEFLTHAAFTPTLGAPGARRVLLEFTDYTCEPCRASAQAARESTAKSADLRVTILLLPTGGALAEYAARMSLAAYRQDPEKFAQLHARLMEDRGAFTQESIVSALRNLGYDLAQIERESVSDESRRYFQQVRRFAEEMEISGVPAFALNDKLHIGGVSAAQLTELIRSGSPSMTSRSIDNRSVDR